MKKTSRWIGVAASWCAIFISQAGCVSLMGKKRSPTLDTSYLAAAGYSIPPGGMPSPVGPAASDGQSIIMEVRNDSEKPHIERIPLRKDRPMFVEDLVQEAKIHERLGGVNISIMRPSGANLPPVRMDVRVKDTGKVKSMEDNYALMPGDHLIVTYDQRSSLEVFFDNVRGS
ncbi:MAG: hypothetical protein IT423_17470 [Pirellulaceae bacterium]|nr:hypothetical protein [Pirellulaceae bacterium]